MAKIYRGNTRAALANTESPMTTFTIAIPMTPTRKHLLAGLIATLPALALLFAVLLRNAGSFSYTLDDPYIHLALARNIALGNYGINLHELSAPSSSIVWPLILAPFSFFPGLFDKVPLILNLLCLFLTASLFIDATETTRWKSTLITLIVLLSLNIYGVVFTGMEHSLQILLVTALTCQLLPLSRRNRRTDGVPMTAFSPRLVTVCLVLLPLVRYEGLAVTVPALLYLWLKGERRIALVAALTSFGLLAAYSLFLYSNGLGLLPSSVLAKSAHAELGTVWLNLRSNVSAYGFLLIPVLFLLAYALQRDRALGLWVVSVTMLHFLFGRYGWYGRYELYYLTFLVLCLFEATRALKIPGIALAMILPLCFSSLLSPFFSTPIAASNIENQQGRMSDIAQRLGVPVAVNDLGLVALRSNQYVLDLWGLGSKAALDHRKRNDGPEWITDLMAAKGVSIAIVYDDWFPQKPANWHKVGEMTLLEPLVTPANATVAFYATDDGSRGLLSKTLRDYAATHPSDRYSLTLAGSEQGTAH
jgi:hypothetical protein